MGNHATKLLHDPDVKKQYLSVAAIATVLAAFELVFYLVIVVPQVQDAVQGLLRGLHLGLPRDHPLRPYVRVPCALAVEREGELVRDLNLAAKASGVLIVLLPFTVIVLLFACSGPLRRQPKRDVIVDVVMVVALLVGFQTFFYFFGRNFTYSSSPELLQDAVENYNRTNDHVLDRPGGVPPPSPLTEAERAELVRTAVHAYRQVASAAGDSGGAAAPAPTGLVATDPAVQAEAARRSLDFYTQMSGLDPATLRQHLP